MICSKSVKIFAALLFASFSVQHTAGMPSGGSKEHWTTDDTTYVAYGRQSVRAVTSALSLTSGEELLKAHSVNLAGALTGRVKGLTVVPRGVEPGMESYDLRIRGTNTFSSGTDILVIVDGVESPYMHLVPEEIESVVLLKDAAATAMYGSRGANGVMLITTRKGVRGPLKISFSTRQGLHQSTGQPDFLGAYDYARYYNEALVNDGEPVAYSAEDLQKFQSGSDPFLFPDVDWYDEVTRNTSYISAYDFNFSGGGERSQYFVLFDLLQSNGLLKRSGDESELSENSRFRKFNFRTNVDLDLTERLSATLVMGGSIDDKSNPVNNTTDGLYEQISKIPPVAFPVYNPNGSYGGNLLYSNPVGDMLETGSYHSNGRTFQGSFRLREDLDMITEGLSISGLVSFNSLFTSISNKYREYIRYSLSTDSNGDYVYSPIGQNTSLTGTESQTNNWYNYVLQGMMEYHKKLGVSTLDATLMYDRSQVSIYEDGLPYNSQGIYGRLSYQALNTYMAEFVFGYNSSDRFPQGLRWGFFPAVSVGWIVSNEGFLKDNGTISFLKVRGSYGLTGNEKVGGARYDYYQNWYTKNNYYLGPANTTLRTFNEDQIANLEKTWEKQKQYNFGLDLSLWDRFSLSVDVFNQNRSDILTMDAEGVPQYFGMVIPNLNVGEMRNRGFETSLLFSADKNSSFKYFIGLETWYARNEILYNAEAYKSFDYLYKTGHPQGQPFLLEAIGFFNDETDIENSPRQVFTQVRPGDLKYKDQNGDQIIDENDYIPTGFSDLPELSAGLHLGFVYKGFDLDMFFHAVGNRSVYLSGSNFYAFQDYGKITSRATGRWTPETADDATYPRLSSVDNLNNFQPSSFWQVNGSFIRLRSLEVGYSLSPGVLNKAGIERARVFIAGTNLLTFDHISDADPEILSGYPMYRTFVLGISIHL